MTEQSAFGLLIGLL